MTQGPVLCSLNEVTVRYPSAHEPALQQITLEIERGKRLAVIGESGSGKSTLAKLLANLLPSSVSVDGQMIWHFADKIRQPPRNGRDIAYIFQDPSSALNPLMPVGKQIGEAAEKHLNLSGKKLKDHVLQLMEKMHLPDVVTLYHAYPHQLSGGQQQRIAIGAALSANPKIIISDEATSALDNEAQAAIINLLDSFTTERDATLIFISHYIALAAQISDHIAIMHEGKIIESGDMQAILRNPNEAYSRALLKASIDLNSTALIGL